MYVSELGNHRVSIFDTNGTFLHCFGKGGSGEDNNNRVLVFDIYIHFFGEGKYGITADTFGNLYVCDTVNNTVVMY